ncbi:MAG: proton-conducting transporter membrane subunit, partial [Propionibacteriaceae bacterium]
MILAAGIGPAGYALAIFHLITHGFFKANMFLGAGSVMHGMGDDTDMRHFGAVRKVMPITFWTFAMGYLAIIGFPGFAGFFSKDHIIEAAFEHNHTAGIIAIAGAAITAFYMTRLMLMTFMGKKRWDAEVHPHESPATMTIPLIVLALLSVVSGFLMNGWIAHWLQPITGAEAHESVGFAEMIINPLGLVTLGVVALGVLVSWFAFGRRAIPRVAPATSNPFVIAGRRDLFAEDINCTVFRDGGRALVRFTTDVDELAVDGAAEGSAQTVSALSQMLRRLQTGYVRSYGLMMAAGAILIGVVLILGRLA